jgi:acyl-CoA:acyl-CoA alkyltransferase
VESTIRHLLHDRTLTRKDIKPLFASLTIGSGAVALVMEDRRLNDTGHYLVGSACYANTTHNDLCQGGQNAEQGTLMSTDSEKLLAKGVETAARCWEDFLAELEWGKESITPLFLPPGRQGPCPAPVQHPCARSCPELRDPGHAGKCRLRFRADHHGHGH